jgi:protein TonB
VNLDPSATPFSFSGAALAAPLKSAVFDRGVSPSAFAYSPSRQALGPRRAVGPVVIVLLSAGLHVLLALSVSRAGAHEAPRLRVPSHLRVTVTRPPLPPKPVEVPPATMTPPPRPRPASPPKKNVVLAPAPPFELPPSEAPLPAEPMLAPTAATEPGAVSGSAHGSIEGTGVEGGARGGVGTVEAAPPAPPPPPVLQAHEGAGYLRNPRPPYPEMARARGWEGQVVLKVRVAASGRAEAVAVKRSSGRRLLDDAALEAVRRWAFVPASQGGTAVAGWVEVPLVFTLQ